MGRGSAEPPKILLPYRQWLPHFLWASDAPDYNTRRFAPRFLISYMYCIKLYSIGKSVSFASHSIILNKHIVIDLRLLFIQRNTQASNNRNTM